MEAESLIRSINKLEKQELFKISRFKPLIKKTKPHTHEGYYELIYLAEGEGFTGGDGEISNKGSGCFLSKAGSIAFLAVHCYS
ncbi:AraC family transcriptional regulator [Nitritalea halalkaliphila LW7]|uniref:AraC family transcriptional regulator n=1 Tax=Nitritalea halalkaliphila LW7 TaxID=1189621 RepID=I5C3L2_9BACT|nr:AraC family transcriptional regulator [Nitritalea halalkaliphila LW7]